MSKPIKICYYNFKGGIGKSTAAINTAYNLQKFKKKVLVVDADLQKNTFSFFSARTYPNVSVSTWNTYKNALETLKMNFDYIIFDLPPAMNDEVKEIIHHCDSVFVPVILGQFEISGLSNVTAEIQRQGAKLGGVFASMFNSQNKDYDAIIELRSILKNRLMNTVIPYSKTVRESQKDELTIEEYFTNRHVPPNPQSWRIVHAYEALTNEILERCNGYEYV